MRAAHTKIEKHPDHVPLFVFPEVLRENLPELPEPSLHYLRTITEFTEPLSGGVNGVGVTIDAEEPEIGARFEQQCGVPTAAHRRVHDQSGGDGEEQFDDLPPHHRDMVELALHVDPLSRRAVGPSRRILLQPPERQAPAGMSPPVVATAESGRSRGQQPRRSRGWRRTRIEGPS